MTIGGFQSNWFNVTTHTLENNNVLPVATVKDENKEEFAAYTKNLLEQLEQRTPSVGKDALTDEQLKTLHDKYDMGSMTYDEYQSFLRDLVDMGALTETDRWLAGGAGSDGLTLLLLGVSGFVRDASMDGMGAPFTYDFPRGEDTVDVTEWITYRASIDNMYYLDGKQCDLGEDKANRTVVAILQAIA
nr:hypothetical protein [uncultured Agathobaculum sp.]